jgi:hypothetical protein
VVFRLLWCLGTLVVALLVSSGSYVLCDGIQRGALLLVILGATSILVAIAMIDLLSLAWRS